MTSETAVISRGVTLTLALIETFLLQNISLAQHHHVPTEVSSQDVHKEYASQESRS